MKTAFSFFLAALLPFSAVAGQDRGGGDEAALEFQQSFRTALEKIEQRYPDLGEKLTGLKEKARTTLVIVTDTPLSVARAGVSQTSVAVNEPERNLIVLHRARWAKVGNTILREAIALHEYASLIGVENTGDYNLSTEYLARHGQEANSLLNPDWEEQRERAELETRLAAKKREERAILREVPAVIAKVKSMAVPWLRDGVKADWAMPVTAHDVLQLLVYDLWNAGYTPDRVDAIARIYAELYGVVKCTGFKEVALSPFHAPEVKRVETDTPLCLAKAVYSYKQRFPKGPALSREISRSSTQ